MVLLRGARGSLEWKGKRLKYVANESARAGLTWRVPREKDPEAPRERSAHRSVDAWPAEAARGGRA